MAARARTKRRASWLGTLLGLAILTTLGFGFGLVAGVLREEPQLLLGHLFGRGEEVAWGDGEPEASEPARVDPVAADPAAVPAVAAPPRALGDGGFVIQVGAFSDSETAENMAGSLQERGFPAHVTASAGAGDERWRVRVGPVSTRERADDLARQLKQQEKLPTWVIKEGGG